MFSVLKQISYVNGDPPVPMEQGIIDPPPALIYSKELCGSCGL
jgi:hypothetical protein